MKLTTATLLCLGMVSATQPVPGVGSQLPAVLQTMKLETVDCTTGKCPPIYYHTQWRVMFADSAMYKLYGCDYLLYLVRVNDMYHKNLPRGYFRKHNLDPDLYRGIDINETCGQKSESKLYIKTFDAAASSIPTTYGQVFRVPISPNSSTPPALLQFEKFILRNGNVVAAVVKHPLIWNTRHLGKGIQSTRSLWINTKLKGPGLTEVEKDLFAKSI